MFEFSDTYVDGDGTAQIFVFPSIMAKIAFETNLALDISINGIEAAAVSNHRAIYIISATKAPGGKYTAALTVVATGETAWSCTSYTNTHYSHALADAVRKLLTFNKKAVNNLLYRLDDLPSHPTIA